MSPRAIRILEVLHVPVPEEGACRPSAPAKPPAHVAFPRSPVAVALDVLLGFLLIAVALVVAQEMKDSYLQSRVLSRIAAGATWQVQPGESPSIRFPSGGPYDRRFGYAGMPSFLARLRQEGAPIEAQARWSKGLADLVRGGVFATYREKDQAGLEVLDRHGRPLYRARWPQKAWARFEDIPPVVVDVLRFIENRELLDPRRPRHNPAVEWDRLALALSRTVQRHLGGTTRLFGGSTLATQVEKFRHSPAGRTRTARDKWRQMESAAIRAYLDGPVTLPAQRRIVLAYVNTMPLGAVPGFGEVLGLPDGLWAWFGRDFDEAGALLRRAGLARVEGEDAGRVGQVFRETVALLLAQRRPAWYRGSGREALERATDSYLRVLARERVIPGALRDLAMTGRLSFVKAIVPDPPEVAGDRKGIDAVRTSLVGLLGLPGLHDLDRLDLQVRSTLDAVLQDSVAGTLRSLRDPGTVRRLKLRQPHLLAAGSPAGLLYSFVLYERDGEAAVLRAQTDEFEGPFSLPDQMKMELGSTAKLRTLVSYLEVMAEIDQRLAREGRSGVRADSDPLAAFVAGWRASHPDGNLPGLLQAALDRTCSASPHQRFRTGGGLMEFANYRKEDDVRRPSVREAFRESINLVFVRLMRDVITSLAESGPFPPSQVLKDPADPRRKELLARFADQEGRVFQEAAWARYGGMDPETAAELLLDAAPREVRPIAAAYRAIRPDGGIDGMEAAIRARLPRLDLDPRRLRDLWETSGPPTLADLQDRGYVAKVHPLTLATVAWRLRHPAGTYAAMLDGTAGARQESYRWLFVSRVKQAQDLRIRDSIEREAFERLHQRWARVGYPFATLVPSLATAIGSSGDQPRALAELAGIVQAGGIRVPLVRVEDLRFGLWTPYETRVGRPGTGGVRVMRPEVAEAVQCEMVQVVEAGTARRVRGAFRNLDGRAWEVGGKTGTGDNRRQTFGPGGRVTESRVLNRTGTFVFFVGDRWFGALTAHVPGAGAARYRFTSALPVEVLRHLAPAILASGDGHETCADVACLP